METFGFVVSDYDADDQDPEAFECWVEAESEELARHDLVDRFGADAVAIQRLQPRQRRVPEGLTGYHEVPRCLREKCTEHAFKFENR